MRWEAEHEEADFDFSNNQAERCFVWIISFMEPELSPNVSKPKKSFTCVTCLLLFNSAEGQRAHYHSELHKFNSKRKIVGLPPIAEQVLDSKTKGNHK